MSIPKNASNLPRTKTNIRLGAIYRNELFQKDAKEFHKDVLTHLLTIKLLDTPDDFKYCSRSFLDALNINKLILRLDSLLDKYKMTDNEFWGFFETYIQTGQGKYLTTLNNSVALDVPISIDLTENDSYVDVRIYPWAKKEDLDDRWKTIESLLQTRKGYKKRHRTPDDPDLIYAVYLARRANKEFKRIAEDINDNKLPGYKREVKEDKHWDQWSLLDHYNRHKHIVDY